MDFRAFEARALEMWSCIPHPFRDGVTRLIIEERVAPDPEFPDVFVMGLCAADDVSVLIPGAPVQDVITIFYGSFAAHAQQHPDFDWDDELWETLTHEVRHHLEWVAGVDDLGDHDDLEREDFSRRAGESFVADYYRRGLRLDEGVYALEKLLFLEVMLTTHEWARLSSQGIEVTWGGVVASCPAGHPDLSLASPIYLTPELDGMADSGQRLPWHDVVLVVREKPTRRDWFSWWRSWRSSKGSDD